MSLTSNVYIVTTARKRCTKEENKVALIRYPKAITESKQGYRKMYGLWNELGTFEIKEQNLAC